MAVTYKSIYHFSVETAGNFDLDSELKIWVSSSHTPTVVKTFKKNTNILSIQKALATFVLK